MNVTIKAKTVVFEAVAAGLATFSLCRADTVSWNVSCVEPVRWLQSAGNWNPTQFPGAADTAVLGIASATPVDVYLTANDMVSISNASVANAANTTVKISVQTGASLIFANSVETTWFANESNTHSELDVDGGSVTFNGGAWFSDTGTGNVIRVRNGGTIDFENAVVFGKAGDTYDGVTKMYIGHGSVVRQNSSYSFLLGDGATVNNGAGAGGEIEIDGGTFVVGDQLFVHCGPWSGYKGHCSIRLKSGEFSFSGSSKSIHFWGCGDVANEFIQSGGQFTGNLSFQWLSGSDDLIEISGGTNTADAWSFGTSSGYNYGRMHMRIVGRESVVKVGRGSFYSAYSAADFTEPPLLMEFVIDPTTRRDSNLPMTPVYVTTPGYSGGYREIRGVHHIRPAGGAQLVHQDYFPMYVKGHDGWIADHGYEQIESPSDNIYTSGFNRYRYGADDQYQTVGEEMWTNVFVVAYKNEVLGTSGATWQFQQKLKSEAAFADGAAALETPVPRGYLDLPAIVARDMRDMKKARVRLAVTPGAGETLQSIVDGFRENGYPDSVVEAAGIYNVCLVIPKSRLAVGVADDKVLFDFSVYSNFKAAKNKTPTIRATLSAAKWDPLIVRRGIVMAFN